MILSNFKAKNYYFGHFYQKNDQKFKKIGDFGCKKSSKLEEKLENSKINSLVPQINNLVALCECESHLKMNTFPSQNYIKNKQKY